jgi:hypothetical protein
MKKIFLTLSLVGLLAVSCGQKKKKRIKMSKVPKQPSKRQKLLSRKSFPILLNGLPLKHLPKWV